MRYSNLQAVDVRHEAGGVLGIGAIVASNSSAKATTRSSFFTIKTLNRWSVNMSTATEDKLKDLLNDFDSAMLVTRTNDGQLRSRPMMLADVDADGSLWFVTGDNSGKMDEIELDDHVNVALQTKRKFVSISGQAKTIVDRRKVDEIWNEAWKVWFPGGKTDPHLQLLKVEGEMGEYWDNSGSSGVKYLIEAGKAYLKGTRPNVEGDPKIHGKVDL